MIQNQLAELLESYDPEIRTLINNVLSHEQSMISFQMATNSQKLKDIKQKLRGEIDKLIAANYEA